MKWMAEIYHPSNITSWNWNPTVSSYRYHRPLLRLFLPSPHPRTPDRAPEGEVQRLGQGDGCLRACTGAMTPQLPSSGLGRRGGGRLASIQPRAARGGWSCPSIMLLHVYEIPARALHCRIFELGKYLALRTSLPIYCVTHWVFTSAIKSVSFCSWKWVDLVHA
jgi:hypothetical protein